MASKLKESHPKYKGSHKYTYDHNSKKNLIRAKIKIKTIRRAYRMWLVIHKDQARLHDSDGI